MKFITKLIPLLSASSTVLSYTVPLNKRQNAELYINEKCNVGIEKYKECVVEDYIVYNELDNICKTYQTEKCQKFFNDGIKVLEECNEFSEINLNYRQGRFDAVKIHLDAACAKDENNQYCSLNLFDFSKRFPEERDEFHNAVNNTCKSKKCTEIAIDYATKEQELKEKLDEIYNQLAEEEKEFRIINSKREFNSTNIEDRIILIHMIEYLKSSECSQMEIDSNIDNILNVNTTVTETINNVNPLNSNTTDNVTRGNATSGTNNTIKYSSTLFAILAFFIFILF